MRFILSKLLLLISVSLSLASELSDSVTVYKPEKLDRSDFMFEAEGISFCLLDIPIDNRVWKKNKVQGSPFTSRQIAKYEKRPDFHIKEQRFFASQSYSRIIISTLFYYKDTLGGWCEQSIIEVYNRVGDLLWTVESDSFQAIKGFVPDGSNEKLAILWYRGDDGYSETKLLVYNKNGIEVDSIQDPNNIKFGFNREHFYYGKLFSDYEYGSVDTLFYYNLRTGERNKSYLDFSNRVFRYIVSINGKYIICKNRDKVYSLDSNMTILYEYELNESRSDIYALSHNGQYTLEPKGQNFILRDNLLNKDLVEFERQFHHEPKYLCGDIGFISGGYYITYLTLDGFTEIAIYDFQGKQVGIIGLEGIDNCHMVSLVETDGQYLFYYKMKLDAMMEKPLRFNIN